MSKKMKMFTVLALSGFALISLALAADDDEGKVEKLTEGVSVLGLAVAKPLPGNGYPQSSINGADIGTRVQIQITKPGKFIVKIDKDLGKLESFVDDKGTDLTKTEKKSFFGCSWLAAFPKIVYDGQVVALGVKAPNVPASGAKTVTVKAKIVLVCGIDEKTETAKDVELKKDTQFKIDGKTFKISDISKNDWGGKKNLNVTIMCSKGIDFVKSIAFIGADGKEIESKQSGWSGGTIVTSKTFSIQAQPEKSTLKVTFFGKMEDVEVPINITCGVGL